MEGEAAGPQSRRPPNNSFRQQTMKAWRPILTPAWVIGSFLAVGVVFVPIGAVCLVTSQSVIEVSVPYDEQCCIENCGAEDADRVDANPCKVVFNVRSTWVPRSPSVPTHLTAAAPRRSQSA